MTNNNLNKNFLNVYEFANYIGVHHNTIRKGIKKGHITAFRIGTGPKSPWRIPKTEVDRMALFNLEDIIEKAINERKDK